MLRLGFAAAVAAAAAPFAGADAPDVASCQVCSAAVTELVKRTPVLKRAAKAEDRQMAVLEAFDQFCISSNFAAYTADTNKMAADCKVFLSKTNADGTLQTAIAEGGGDVAAACASVCAEVPEAERLPSYTPTPKAKASKAGKAGGSSGSGGASKREKGKPINPGPGSSTKDPRAHPRKTEVEGTVPSPAPDAASGSTGTTTGTGSSKPAKASKGSTKPAKAGSVDDPKYKDALKKKAERDARRAKAREGGAGEEEEL